MGVVAVADAVVGLLVPVVLGLGGTVSRSWVPRLQLEDVEALRVDVVPSGVEMVRADRGSWQHELAVDIAIRQRSASITSADAAAAAAEQIAAAIVGAPVLASDLGVLVGLRAAPLYDPADLDELGQLTSVLTAVYRRRR